MHEITFKVRHDGKFVRRFNLPVYTVTWHHLKEKIEALFNLSRTLRGVLYIDNDGDCILISSNEELAGVINLANPPSTPIIIRLETVMEDTDLPKDSWLMESEQEGPTSSQAESVITVEPARNEEGQQRTAIAPISGTEHVAEPLVTHTNDTSLHIYPVMMPTVSSVPPVVNNGHTNETTTASPSESIRETTQVDSPPPRTTSTTTTERTTSADADLPPLGSQIASLARQFVHTLQSNSELNENARQVLDRTVSTVEQSFTQVVRCLQTEFAQVYNTVAAHTGLRPHNARRSTNPTSSSSANASFVPSNYPVEVSPVSPPDTSPDPLWMNRSSEEEAARIDRQMKELKEMGFYDEVLCRRVLAQHVDISSAVQSILEATNSDTH